MIQVKLNDSADSLDYFSYFELPPAMKGLELPKGVGEVSKKSLSDIVALLRSDWERVNRRHHSDYFHSIRSEVDRVFSLLANESLIEEEIVDALASDLKFLKHRARAMTSEMLAIKILDNLGSALSKYRDTYRQISANKHCILNFAVSCAVIGLGSIESTAAVAFYVGKNQQLIDPTKLSKDALEKLRFLKDHEDEDLSAIAEFILAHRKLLLLNEKIEKLYGEIYCRLQQHIEHCESSRPIIKKAYALSRLTNKIFHNYYDYISLHAQLGYEGIFKLSTKLMFPSEDRLSERSKNIKDWQKELPQKEKEYKAIWDRLEQERRKSREKLNFTRIYMSSKNEIEGFGFSQYQKVAIEMQELAPRAKKSIKVIEEKKGPVQKPKGKNRKPKKNVSRTVETVSVESSKSLAKIESVDPFESLKAPALETYSARVLDWFQDAPCQLRLASYSNLTSQEKEKQHLFHGFSLEVDRFLESDYSVTSDWENKTTGHKDKRVSMPAEISWREMTYRGIITVCYGAKGEIYHRYMTVYPTKDLLELVRDSFYKFDFPSLDEGTTFFDQTAPVSCGTRSEKKRDRATLGPFESVIIKDKRHDAKITLFKMS